MKNGNKREKIKKAGKKLGIIGCLIGGIYGIYELADICEVKEMVTELIGDGSKLQEKIRGQIKQCVKEAIAEYEAERYEREARERHDRKRASEVVNKVIQGVIGE